MNLLIDNAVSPKIADGLRRLGRDAVHVSEIGFEAPSDEVILSLALEQGRVVISIDTDFGALLATSSSRKPSVVLIRRESGRSSQHQFRLLRDNLPALESILAAGAIIVMEDGRIRIRPLPIGSDKE